VTPIFSYLVTGIFMGSGMIGQTELYVLSFTIQMKHFFKYLVGNKEYLSSMIL
jgi:hypothetical protein